MGAYATWVEDKIHREYGGIRSGWPFRVLALGSRLWSWLRAAPLNPRRTVVLAEFEPTADQLIQALGGLPAWIVMASPPRQPLSGIRYAQGVLGVNPLVWDSAVEEAISAEIDTVATFQNWNGLYGRTLRQWHQRGIRRCWFLRERPLAGIPPWLGAAYKLVQTKLSRLWNWDRLIPREECLAFLTQVGAAGTFASPRGILHYIGSLGSGGAERQLCNTVIRQHQAGLSVRVILAEPPHGSSGYYLPLLQDAGVPVHWAGSAFHDSFPDAWAKRNLPLPPLMFLHPHLRTQVMDLLGEILVQPPEVLHCWLDYTNVAGLIGAQLSGVPRTLLSLRAVSPEQCPRLLTPWMRAWYQVGAELPGVKIVANSAAGARDYERWLAVPSGHIKVLNNAFIPPPAPSAQAIADFRRQFGLNSTTPVVAGVFRLDPEKRPLFFLSIIKKIQAQIPDLRVLMAGCGSLEEAVKQEIARLGLSEIIHLLGLRRDVPVILSASQVLLLTSNVEGTPNVALEAQHFGCVPVLTDAGGSREAIQPGVTGLLYGMEDKNGLVEGVTGLLRDAARRAALAQGGRAFVAQQFDPQAVHERTLNVYDSIGFSADAKHRQAA